MTVHRLITVHTWVRAFFLVILLTTIIPVFGQTAFVCDGAFYQIRNPNSTSSNLFRLNRDSNPYTTTQIGSTINVRVNALGYNPTDNLLYAMAASTNTIYRIDATGNAVSQGTVANLPVRDYNNGTFDSQGNFYVTFASTNLVYRIMRSGTTWSATALTFNASVNSGDIAFDPVSGLLYGFLDNQLIRYNPATLQVTTIPVTGYATTSQPAGSVSFDAAGTFYVYRNAGGFYVVDTTNGAAALVSSSPASTSSDGASCVVPDYKVDVVKQTTEVTRVDLRTYDVTFRITVGNRYTSVLPNVQVNDFIGPGSGATFATSSSVTLLGAPQLVSGSCALNTAFSRSDSRLLSGTGALAAGQECTITFSLRVLYPNASSVPANNPSNTAYASSRTTSNSGYTLASGTPVPPTSLLAADSSTNVSALPASPNTDTPSASPVVLQRTPVLNLTKEVRNQTQGGAFGTTAQARPGDAIEYCVRFDNTGSGTAGSVAISDFLSVEQTFVDDAYGSGSGLLELNASGSEVARYSSAQDTDAAEWSEAAGQVTFRKGDVTAGQVGSLCFQARVH